MDFVSPLVELVKELLGLANKPLGYICNLKDNVGSLKSVTKDLKVLSDDVKETVEREEKQMRAQRTKEVANWFEKVQIFFNGVDQVLREAAAHDQIKCLSRCLSPNCWSSYKLGKRVDQMLNEAGKLQSEQKEFNGVTSPLPTPRVLKMPMDETVGLDSSLNEVWKWLVDEKLVGVIGLYGIGGVGKTALMKRINKDLLHANHGFDIVIWVEVSKEQDKEKIQDTIRKRLDIKDELWKGWSKNDRFHNLLEDLTGKKFALLIDDLWEKLDLLKIGVPSSPKNGSKVVFTTRSKRVCKEMDADKTFEVPCLTNKEALELFVNNVGKSTVYSHSNILELAKGFVQECKGLPLALITVGKFMAGFDNHNAWEHLLTTLKKYPHELPGMVEKVYCELESSYISLNDSNLQHCFLYCCLFPNNYRIRPHNLIGLWIEEGLLKHTSNVYIMRDEGEYVLEMLKKASLLESGFDSNGEYVKMHGIIRDMATWITRDRGKSENKLLVIENKEDMSVELISKWREAEKVSLWGNQISNIVQTPPSSQLETLFIRETNVKLMPSGFFNSMTSRLTVLDLSNNRKIQSFPENICDLINLRYLNLSTTWIRELPEEIENLIHLRWLLLDDIAGSFIIPIREIASLPLNVFSMWGSSLEKEEEMLDKLEHMKHLTDLSINVYKSSSAMKIFQSQNSCIRRVSITNEQKDIVINYSTEAEDNNGFLHLEVLYLSFCHKLVKMEITRRIGRAPNCFCFPNLGEVIVKGCRLSDLSWLVHAPKLRELRVENCELMRTIIGNGFAAEAGLFSCLQSLSLLQLQMLTSICDQTLFFPRGVTFYICQCPLLGKLPLDSNSKECFSVSGDKNWWAEFKWDPAAEVTFQLDDEGPAKNMKFEEAVRKVKDESITTAKIGFEPRRRSQGD